MCKTSILFVYLPSVVSIYVIFIKKKKEKKKKRKKKKRKKKLCTHNILHIQKKLVINEFDIKRYIEITRLRYCSKKILT